MRFFALAAGFDGTLARNGRYDERCVEALSALSATGRKLILVTARELREVFEIFPEARIFDVIVAENGAVMHRPASRESQILAAAPSEILLQELQRRGIAPVSAGSSIIKTSIENEPEVRSAIVKLDLDCQLIVNEHSLIVLPQGVIKASGVREALRQLGISRHNLAVIGDAQNDLALFQLAEHSVAVQNADPLLKQCADRTTSGAFGEGLLELCRELMLGDLAYAVPKVNVVLGRKECEEFHLEPVFDSLLVCDSRGRNTSGFGQSLMAQLDSHAYQCCIIGTHLTPERLASSIDTFGSAQEAPRLSALMEALEQGRSVAVNLAALPAESRPVFAETLLLQLQALHDRVGRPHAVLIQQAHWFLADGLGAACASRLAEMTVIYETSEPHRLPPETLQSISSVVALGADAQIPQVFAEFGAIAQIKINDPKGASEGVPAQMWIRSPRAAYRNPLHAIAGGAVCAIEDVRPSVSAVSSDEVSSLSGY
jgi:HAD superfamily hydrolase (TIGR01484 family)